MTVHSYHDRTVSADKRLDDLLSCATLDQKLGQMMQPSVRNMPPQHFERDLAGSCALAMGERTNEWQKRTATRPPCDLGDLVTRRNPRLRPLPRSNGVFVADCPFLLVEPRPTLRTPSLV